MRQCRTCPLGWGQADAGTCETGGGRDRTCAPCEPGRYSTAVDASPCTDCPAGKFGYEAAATDSDACQPCERDDVAWDDGTNVILYHDARESAYCPGGSVRLVKKGFWRAAADGNHTESSKFLTYKVCLLSWRVCVLLLAFVLRWSGMSIEGASE